MEKISISNKFQEDLQSRAAKLKEVREHIEKQSGFKLASISFAKQKIVAKALNNYEAVEIRMKLQHYLDLNGVRVV